MQGFCLLEFKITQFPGGFCLNTFGGGLVSGGAFNWMYFCLQLDGPVTHWGAHKWGSFISGSLQYT